MVAFCLPITIEASIVSEAGNQFLTSGHLERISNLCSLAGLVADRTFPSGRPLEAIASGLHSLEIWGNRAIEAITCTDQGVLMALPEILASIDSEIAQLQKARALLVGAGAPAAKRKAGRPRKVAVEVVTAPTRPAKKKRRNLSPEGRKRIAEAVKRRWAAQKKAASSAAK